VQILHVPVFNKEVIQMNTRKRIFQLFVSALLLGVLGCGPASPLYLHPRGQVDKHYINTATRIEYPDTHVETSQEVLGAIAPLTVANPNPNEIYELSLEEAVCIALKNSKVVRTLSGVGFSSAGVPGVPRFWVPQSKVDLSWASNAERAASTPYLGSDSTRAIS
jgi:predicted small lipoprotein YifL